MDGCVGMPTSAFILGSGGPPPSTLVQVTNNHSVKVSAEQAEAEKTLAFWREQIALLCSQDPPQNLRAACQNISERGIATSVLSAFFDALARCPTVKICHFEMTEFDDAACEALRAAGGPSVNLRALYLSRNRITAAGLPPLIASTLERGRLTTLNLSCNPLGDQIAALGRAVAASGSLTHLNLDETRCGAGVVEFAEALAKGGPLRQLSLQNNGIGDIEAAMIADPIAASGLEEILLGRNSIGDAGASALARTLLGSSLRRLSLTSNDVRDAGACEFASALDGCAAKLHALNLGHNKIGDLGVAALAAAVRANANLGKLDVGVNLASRQRTDVLRAAMAPEALRRRRLAAFRAAARVVLAAYNRDVRGGVAPDPPRLGCLPFALVLVVLKHACLAWGGADAVAELEARGLKA